MEIKSQNYSHLPIQNHTDSYYDEDEFELQVKKAMESQLRAIRLQNDNDTLSTHSNSEAAQPPIPPLQINEPKTTKTQPKNENEYIHPLGEISPVFSSPTRNAGGIVGFGRGLKTLNEPEAERYRKLKSDKVQMFRRDLDQQREEKRRLKALEFERQQKEDEKYRNYNGIAYPKTKIRKDEVPYGVDTETPAQVTEPIATTTQKSSARSYVYPLGLDPRTERDLQRKKQQEYAQELNRQMELVEERKKLEKLKEKEYERRYGTEKSPVNPSTRGEHMLGNGILYGNQTDVSKQAPKPLDIIRNDNAPSIENSSKSPIPSIGEHSRFQFDTMSMERKHELLQKQKQQQEMNRLLQEQIEAKRKRHEEERRKQEAYELAEEERVKRDLLEMGQSGIQNHSDESAYPRQNTKQTPLQHDQPTATNVINSGIWEDRSYHDSSKVGRNFHPISPRNFPSASPRHLQPSSPRHLQPSSPRHLQPSSPRNFPPASPRNFQPSSPGYVQSDAHERLLEEQRREISFMQEEQRKLQQAVEQQRQELDRLRLSEQELIGKDIHQWDETLQNRAMSRGDLMDKPFHVNENSGSYETHRKDELFHQNLREDAQYLRDSADGISPAHRNFNVQQSTKSGTPSHLEHGSIQHDDNMGIMHREAMSRLQADQQETMHNSMRGSPKAGLNKQENVMTQHSMRDSQQMRFNQPGSSFMQQSMKESLEIGLNKQANVMMQHSMRGSQQRRSNYVDGLQHSMRGSQQMRSNYADGMQHSVRDSQHMKPNQHDGLIHQSLRNSQHIGVLPYNQSIHQRNSPPNHENDDLHNHNIWDNSQFGEINPSTPKEQPTEYYDETMLHESNNGMYGNKLVHQNQNVTMDDMRTSRKTNTDPTFGIPQRETHHRKSSWGNMSEKHEFEQSLQSKSKLVQPNNNQMNDSWQQDLGSTVWNDRQDTQHASLDIVDEFVSQKVENARVYGGVAGNMEHGASLDSQGDIHWQDHRDSENLGLSQSDLVERSLPAKSYLVYVGNKSADSHGNIPDELEQSRAQTAQAARIALKRASAPSDEEGSQHSAKKSEKKEVNDSSEYEEDFDDEDQHDIDASTIASTNTSIDEEDWGNLRSPTAGWQDGANVGFESNNGAKAQLAGWYKDGESPHVKGKKVSGWREIGDDEGYINSSETVEAAADPSSVKGSNARKEEKRVTKVISGDQRDTKSNDVATKQRVKVPFQVHTAADIQSEATTPEKEKEKGSKMNKQRQKWKTQDKQQMDIVDALHSAAATEVVTDSFAGTLVSDENSEVEGDVVVVCVSNERTIE